MVAAPAMVAPPARMEREMRMGFMRITLVKES
jgi:hypothetical protein